MLTAEHAVKEKNRKTGKMETVWKLRPGFIRNEALDVRVGNMAVRDILNPNYATLAAALMGGTPRSQTEVKTTPQPKSKPISTPSPQYKTTTLPGWFKNRR